MRSGRKHAGIGEWHGQEDSVCYSKLDGEAIAVFCRRNDIMT